MCSLEPCFQEKTKILLMCSGPWLRASVLYIGINYLQGQKKKGKMCLEKKIKSSIVDFHAESNT